MIDQHVPKRAPDNQQSAPRRPVQGPSWYKTAKVGHSWNASHNDGFHWKVVKVEKLGRVVHWECEEDGRKAVTECAPTHPDYPQDLTEEQRRAAARDLKQRRLRFFQTFGYWPAENQV